MIDALPAKAITKSSAVLCSVREAYLSRAYWNLGLGMVLLLALGVWVHFIVAFWLEAVVVAAIFAGLSIGWMIRDETWLRTITGAAALVGNNVVIKNPWLDTSALLSMVVLMVLVVLDLWIVKSGAAVGFFPGIMIGGSAIHFFEVGRVKRWESENQAELLATLSTRSRFQGEYFRQPKA